MADFSAITIGENTYDVKDATARTGLAGKQNKLTAGTGISIVGDVISATGGGGLPDNTITYSQFIQMSDAEQLAFTGYVTDYPGIDDAPTAGDTVFDHTGTDLVSNNVNDAIVEVNDKFKTETISNIFTPDAGITVNTIDAYKIGNEIHLTLSVNATTAMTEGFIGSIASQYMPSGSTVPVAVGAGLARKTSVASGATYTLGCWLSTNSKIFIQTTTACGGLALSMTWRI